MGRVSRRQFVVAAGTLLAAPLAAAQKPSKSARVGVLAQAFRKDAVFWKPFFDALAERGWREGAELSLEIREARGDLERARKLAREIVEQGIDATLAIGTAAAVAARQATDRIPIVSWVGYPVEAGLASSLARPGGNVTGVANYAGTEVWGKFIELLRELRPGLQQIGVLWDYAPPASPDGLVPVPEIERTAQRVGIGSRIWMVRSEKDLNDALQGVERSSVQALIISHGGGVHLQPSSTARIEGLLARRRLPAITDVSHFKSVPMGCVLAYSPYIPELLSRLATLLDRVLRGANPATLPFERPARFDLTVSAKAANAITLTLPQSILLRADRVIE